MTDRPRGVAPVAHPKMSPPSLLRETSLPVGSPAMVELATDGVPKQPLRGPSSHPCPALDLAPARTISSVGCHAAGCYAWERGPFRTPRPPSRRTGAPYAGPTAPPPATSTPWSFESGHRWQPQASGRSGRCSGNGAPALGGSSPTAARCRMRPPCGPRQSSAPRTNPRSLAGDRHCDLGY